MDGMEAALEEARKAMAEGEVPVGAALFRGEEILWADHNRREQRQDPQKQRSHRRHDLLKHLISPFHFPASPDVSPSFSRRRP